MLRGFGIWKRSFSDALLHDLAIWSRVKVETQRSVTCNLMKKGGTGDGGGGGFWRRNLQQTKSYLPPLPSLFPPFEVTGSTLANVLLLKRYKSIVIA